MKWIENLVKGEMVIIHVQYGRHELLKRVKKITKTLIITEDGNRFSKQSGCTPGSGYNKNRIEEWSQEKENKIKIKIAKINYNHKFQKFDWTSVSIENLRKINSIIKEN